MDGVDGRTDDRTGVRMAKVDAVAIWTDGSDGKTVFERYVGVGSGKILKRDDEKPISKKPKVGPRGSGTMASIQQPAWRIPHTRRHNSEVQSGSTPLRIRSWTSKRDLR